MHDNNEKVNADSNDYWIAISINAETFQVNIQTSAQYALTLVLSFL